MSFFKKVVLAITVFFGGILAVSAVNNPCLPLLDSGLVRYNGMYYGMGLMTNGQLFVSENLIDWQEPISVLEATEPSGPYELMYRNGLFYLYRDGRGYAVSSNPMGPFSDFSRGGVSGVDMRLFQDPSGALFSVNRQVGSKKAGEIWLQPYSEAWKTSGKPDRLLDGRRGMWDSFDSADLGDPEILSHRGNYYLLYGANSASPRTGLREFGVAIHEKPGRITNSDKQARIVLGRNVKRLARNYEPILPTAELAEWACRYTFKPPRAGWQLPDYPTSGWRSDGGGFGYPDEDNGAQIHAARSKWDASELWIRRPFKLQDRTPKKLVLKIRHETGATVFINGARVYQSMTPVRSYIYVDVTELVEGRLGPDNLAAVYAAGGFDKTGYRFIDFGLYEAGSEEVETSVVSLARPRFVEGLNGFEKWISYRAFWDGVLGTGLDRVFFMDKELYVDGPTTTNTPGYHPPPAAPTFSDSFSTNTLAGWDVEYGDWTVKDGVLIQSVSKNAAYATIKAPAAKNYLFEANLRLPKNGKGRAGVIACSAGEQKMLVFIDPDKRLWGYRTLPGDSLDEKTFKLPANFSFNEKPTQFKEEGSAYHRLRITKNGGYFGVELDQFKLTLNKPIITRFEGEGLPGLCTKNTAAAFDGVVYTIGWDEADAYINGWGRAADGTASVGEWRLTREDGLEQKRFSEKGLAFKGDLLDCYEFTVNARTERLEEDKDKLYGIFPVYVDQNNYLRAVIDASNRQLLVTGKKDGAEMRPQTVSLARSFEVNHQYDTDTSFDNIVNWIYKLRSESIVTRLDIRWCEGFFKHLRMDYQRPTGDLYVKYAWIKDNRKIAFWEDSRFYDADEQHPENQKPHVLNPITIREVKGNYISVGAYEVDTIVVDKRTGDYIRPDDGSPLREGEMIVDDIDTSADPARPDETVVHVEVESSYFFRCVKLADRVIIELNGEPMLEVKGAWPASQVGLFSQGTPCLYNGMTLMHLPQDRENELAQ